jgi:glycosyl transferase family 25
MSDVVRGRAYDYAVYVISLVGATKRRASMSGQLMSCPAHWEFVDGVVPDATAGYEWDPVGVGARARLTLGRPMSRGEFGCAHSHLAAYRKFLADGYRYALILEDDAVFSNDIWSYCGPVFDGVDFDVLLVGYSKVLPVDVCTRAISEPTRPLVEFLGRSVGVAFRERRCGTVGYVITRSGAERLLALQNPVSTVADDWPLFRSKGLRVLHLRPTIVREDFLSHESELSADRALLEGKGPLRAGAWRVLARVVRGVVWRGVLALKTRHGGFRFKQRDC